MSCSDIKAQFLWNFHYLCHMYSILGVLLQNTRKSLFILLTTFLAGWSKSSHQKQSFEQQADNIYAGTFLSVLSTSHHIHFYNYDFFQIATMIVIFPEGNTFIFMCLVTVALRFQTNTNRKSWKNHCLLQDCPWVYSWLFNHFLIVFLLVFGNATRSL